MRASTGEHYVALDHVRALAAFMVVSWHFLHGLSVGYPIPFNQPPAVFPLALLDEGHTGVSLFMTLSGYIFAKLLEGKRVHFGWFLWNRALRLLPLLLIVLVSDGVVDYLRGHDPGAYALSVAKGVLLPTLPNGGWSLTVEFHYYLILPVILFLFRRSGWLPIMLVVLTAAFRLALAMAHFDVQSIAYGTIVGRIDQFVLGMLAFRFRSYFAGRHLLAAAGLTAFAGFYWWFDRSGGLFHYGEARYSGFLWAVMPTLEGLAYALGIAWYDNSFQLNNNGISFFIGRIGAFSYSIYLLHFWIVFKCSEFVGKIVPGISNFYVALGFSILFLVFFSFIGALSFRFIEAPFLKLRRRYTTPIC